MTRTASSADVIVQSLIGHGVDTVFGIPGVQTYPLFDAMARAGPAGGGRPADDHGG